MSADFDTDDRTEQPTLRRRQELRERGQVPRSADLNLALALLAGAAALNYFGGDLTRTLRELLRRSLSAGAWLHLDTGTVMAELFSLAAIVGQALLPILALILGAAVAANVIQVGFLFTTMPLTPDLNRIHPLSGLSRLWSLPNAMKLVFSLLKFSVAVTIVAAFFSANFSQFLQGSWDEVSQLSDQLGAALTTLSLQLALGLLLLAGLDYGFQRWKFEQDIRMTRQEVLDELRDSEGDPQLKQRRREAHRKLFDAQQLRDVQRARVLISNGADLVVAIQYDPGRQPAPTVVARGKGTFALALQRAAQVRGIPTVEKSALASALYYIVPVGRSIPADAFAEVAAVLSSLPQQAPSRTAA
ncbi:MAG: EscU/YscU/HrcU family type III secretion system export apparatus switch protein [Planctomycetes bacterium]|nr:EscU/YscU/HrcU family type III secretion system export apparatus switch protein [Planctomycetota bacterium]